MPSHNASVQSIDSIKHGCSFWLGRRKCFKPAKKSIFANLVHTMFQNGRLFVKMSCGCQWVCGFTVKTPHHILFFSRNQDGDGENAHLEVSKQDCRSSGWCNSSYVHLLYCLWFKITNFHAQIQATAIPFALLMIWICHSDQWQIKSFLVTFTVHC